MINTKTFLLLILSLMAGCEVKPVTRGCTGGWIEISIRYPKTRASHGEFIIKTPFGNIRSPGEDKGRIHWYNDTKNEIMMLLIKQLKQKDAGEYSWNGDQYSTELELQREDSRCQKPFHQTAYTTAQTTITCTDLGNKDKSRTNFLCKEKGVFCEEISSTGSKERFTLTDDNNSLNLSISHASLEDAGVYWCGQKINHRNVRIGLRNINLEVQRVTEFTRSPTVGQTLKYWCDCKCTDYEKFICKGEDPSRCERVISTSMLNVSSGTFSMSDTKEGNTTITVTNVTADDAGTYWCGAESPDPEHSPQFFHRLIMTVVAPSTPSTSTPPVPSTQSNPAEIHGDVGVGIIVVICVVTSVTVPALILIYKRRKTRNGAAAQHVREDDTYEETQERLPKSDTANAVNTVYVSPSFPTNPSASVYYATIKFPNSCDKAGGGSVTPEPSSSACEYSSIKIIESSTH